MTTKKAFFAEADRLGVEVQVWGDYDGSRSFQALCPAGKQFDGSSCHTAFLGDYEKGDTLNWKWMITEIQQVECENGDNCDYCHPED